MNRENEYGVILEAGASDWQIFQQDNSGKASIQLAGRYVLKRDQNPGTIAVHVRLVREDGYEAVTAGLNWQAAATRPDGTWLACRARQPRRCSHCGLFLAGQGPFPHRLGAAALGFRHRDRRAHSQPSRLRAHRHSRLPLNARLHPFGHTPMSFENDPR